jgi:hypothetical protein
VGSWWLYRVVDSTTLVTTYKRVSIEAMENVGGTGPNASKPGIRHLTCKGVSTPTGCNTPPGPTNPVDKTVGWWGSVDMGGGKVWVNYREQAFRPSNLVTPGEEDWWDPYRIKFDATPDHMKMGATYTERFTEWKMTPPAPAVSSVDNVTWTVGAINETIMVVPPTGAAKSYPNCVKISHSTALGASTKNFWYCRNIGKVKETGGQTEELIDSMIKP